MKLGNYKCRTWQSFVQQAINFAMNGYYFYHFYTLDKKKREKSFPKIDAIIVEAYGTNMSKDRRYYNKKAGKANYAYLRYEGMIAVLKTIGTTAPADKEDDPDITKRKQYNDFRKTALVFQPTQEGKLVLKIGQVDNQITLRLTDNCFERIKKECSEHLMKFQIKQLLYTFKALNNIPPYMGVYRQKLSLKRYLLIKARKHGIALKPKDLPVSSKLIRRKVYDND
jgi:predicted DNA binding CopG/RHH family protein